MRRPSSRISAELGVAVNTTETCVARWDAGVAETGPAGDGMACAVELGTTLLVASARLSQTTAAMTVRHAAVPAARMTGCRNQAKREALTGRAVGFWISPECVFGGNESS